MDYLALVNKVALESGMEQGELTPATWISAEAGRRRWPQIKDWVRSAWQDLQMERNEWEFKNKEITTVINPRIVVDDIVSSAPSIGPAPGVKYKGQDSGLELTVITIQSGANLGDFYIDFSSTGQWNRATLGEVFEELSPNAGDSSFVYRGRGAYRLNDLDPLMREPRWDTFVGYQGRNTPIPIIYMPWENWIYKELSYTTTTRSAPSFVSQDYKGDLTFYPQTLSPFSVNFVYPTAPQMLENYDDVPLTILLPFEYHEWISWRALEKLARYDKNPDLLAYAQSESTFYKTRAERNLMPLPSWAGSRYNYPLLRSWR